MVKRCECFETMNALHQPKLENFGVKPPHVFAQEVVGQSGGCRIAKRTPNRKDGTVWTEAGMRGRKSLERPRLQLQGSIPSLATAPAPTPGKITPSSGGDSGSKYLDSGNFCPAPLLTHDPGKHADSGSMKIYRRRQLTLGAKCSGSVSYLLSFLTNWE